MSVRLDHGKDELDEVHEINVTPFIDVMLMLLIIFMVAAPLATVDISVDLPSSSAPPQERPPQPIFLTVKPDLSLMFGDDTVERSALGESLDQAGKGNKDTRVFLRADKVVPYGDVMDVINLLRAAGFLKVASRSRSIDREGHKISSAIVKSSGYPLLDQETMATVRRAQPFLAPPAALDGATFDFTVPVKFKHPVNRWNRQA